MRADHPDAEQVRDLIANLTAWLDIEVHDPTSQITGGGAVRYAEGLFSDLHGARPSAALPSATLGMRATLLAVGVSPGQRVLLPAIDWTATLAAVRAIGATPALVEVDPATMTIDPFAVQRHLADDVAAVVACHLHGVAADVPAIRDAVGDIPIVEDCAQALGSSIDGQLCGTHGDYAVFSFANKTVNAGEAAMVSSATPELHQRLLELTAHPVRQILDGVSPPNLAAFSTRVAPACAMQLAVALNRWEHCRALADHNRLKALLPDEVRQAVLGNDSRRENAAPAIPIRTTAPGAEVVQDVASPSTALDIASVINGHPQSADASLIRPSDHPNGESAHGGRRAG
jgi:hypothetical protein